MKYLNFYFLDRNVISLIKDNNAKRVLDDIQRKKICYLKSIDKKKNIITPILSIWEGENGKLQSIEEKNKTLLKESNEIKRFFLKAKIDSNILIEYTSLPNILSDEAINKCEIWLDLLNNLNQKLYQPLKIEDKSIVFNEIIKYCESKQQCCYHLVPALCIAALYSNKDAKNVLKFKKNNFKPYNALFDIYFLVNFFAIQAHINQVNTEISCKLLTFDIALKNVISSIKLNNSRCIISSNHSDYKITITYNKDFFQDMPDDIFEKYFNNNVSSAEINFYNPLKYKN